MTLEGIINRNLQTTKIIPTQESNFRNLKLWPNIDENFSR